MGETRDQDAKFLSSCETVKPDKFRALKIQWWNRHGIDTHVSKVINREGKSDGFQACPRPSKAKT